MTPTMDIFSTTPTHPIPDGEVELLGAVDTVTGAMSRAIFGDTRVLIDCGVTMGDAPRAPLPDEALEVDAVLLTHGHTDHVGGLVELLERGYDGPIYGTRATLEIARIVVRDGIRLQGGGDRDTRRFCKAFDAQRHDIRYGRPLELPGGVSARFHEAGHILGSTSIELRSPASRVLMSGDLGRPDSPLLRDYNTDYEAGAPFDLVVLESTYGDRTHARSAADVERELERIIHRARRDSGQILVPSFAIGRAQTLLYHLNSLVEDGRVQDLPVALDSPMAIDVTELYQSARSLFDREAMARIADGDDPLEFDALYAVNRARDSYRIQEVEEMFVIAGSGMCTGGRIVNHLKALLGEPETCVLFVGYQARGTLGRAIQDRARRGGGSVRIDGERVPVRAEIATLSGLSAHADRDELAAWLRAVPDPRRVALNHGEPDAQRAFAAHLSDALS